MDGSERWGQPLTESELFAPESFGTRLSVRDGAAWLAMGGELDVFTAPRLREALAEAERTASERLVLDLRGLSFLDSSGLAAILGAHDRLAASGDVELGIVIRGSATVETLFETIGAGDYLPLVDDPTALSGV